MKTLFELIQAEAEGMSPDSTQGQDWWQLSDAEEDVFELDPDRLPLMATAWEAYQAFQGLTSGSEWDMTHQAALDAARAERPELTTHTNDRAAWTDFAAAYAGMSNREAWQWYLKNQAWEGRHGIIVFRDGS